MISMKNITRYSVGEKTEIPFALSVSKNIVFFYNAYMQQPRNNADRRRIRFTERGFYYGL